MSSPSTPPIAAPARTWRCSVCAAEHEPYTGDKSEDHCVVFEAFHAHRGAQLFCVCHACSTRLVAAWAKARHEHIAATREQAADQKVEITECENCGCMIAGGRLCVRCQASE